MKKLRQNRSKFEEHFKHECKQTEETLKAQVKENQKGVPWPVSVHVHKLFCSVFPTEGFFVFASRDESLSIGRNLKVLDDFA